MYYIIKITDIELGDGYFSGFIDKGIKLCSHLNEKMVKKYKILNNALKKADLIKKQYKLPKIKDINIIKIN